MMLYLVCSAEREVMEACVRQLESPSLPAGVRDLLAPLVTLFAAASVERELSWYMGQEIVPARVSRASRLSHNNVVHADGLDLLLLLSCLPTAGLLLAYSCPWPISPVGAGSAFVVLLLQAVCLWMSWRVLPHQVVQGVLTRIENAMRCGL